MEVTTLVYMILIVILLIIAFNLVIMLVHFISRKDYHQELMVWKYMILIDYRSKEDVLNFMIFGRGLFSGE